MSGIFGPYYSSSSTHRGAQKASAVATVVENGLNAISGGTLNAIPSKVVQIGSSGYTVFCTSTHTSEKIINGLEAGITLAQLALIIALYVMGEECANDEHALCKAYFILEAVYSGLLALALGIGEMSKDPTSPSVPTV